MRPTRKITAAGLGGATATVIVLGAVWLGAPEPPPGFEGALATVCAFAAGWWMRS